MAVCPSLTQLHLSVALQCFSVSRPGWWCCFMQCLKCSRLLFWRTPPNMSQTKNSQSLHLYCYTLSLSPLLLLFCVQTVPPGPHGFQERLAASQEAMKNKNVVNLGAIRQGMKRFQFLLNCCEPGTIPDASILAAALDLVRFLDFAFSCPQMLSRLHLLCRFFQEAPVVARASLFLECARFVHRCNRGNWPEWMKGHHVNITKRGLSRGRSPIVGNKRNQKLQWNAAKHFCQWGDVSLRFFRKHDIFYKSARMCFYICFIRSGNRHEAERALSLRQRESCQHPGIHFWWGDQTEDEERRRGRGLPGRQWVFITEKTAVYSIRYEDVVES